MSKFLTIGIGTLGTTVNAIFLRVKEANDSTVINYGLSRDEARKVGRALICYADLADELDKPDTE